MLIETPLFARLPSPLYDRFISLGTKIQKISRISPARAFFFNSYLSIVAFFNEAVFSLAIDLSYYFCGVCIASEVMPSGGSHPRYDRQVRALLEANIDAGVRSRDIAQDMGVSESFVCQMRSHISTFGSIDAASSYNATQGRLRKIHHEAKEGIIDFLEKYPIARRDEICDFLSDEYNISYCPKTAGRVLKDLKITHKAVSWIHTEQDDELRAAYLAEIA